MLTHRPTRRAFCALAALAGCGARLLPAQGSASRPNVNAIDHDRILAAADAALLVAPVPLTSLKSPAENPRLFYTDSDFTAHRDALLALSRRLAALAAAFQITRDERYAAHGNVHLKSWFLAPATSMAPEVASGPKPRFEAILDALPLAEITQAIPFLSQSPSLPPGDRAALNTWFAAYLDWLNTSRPALLARDQKDHHGLSWLLQAAGCARLTANDAALRDLSHRFKTVTLRANLVADGSFPHELTTPYPYRNSLFALDLLAGSGLLLSTQFDSLWNFELQDGPGLRVAIAHHFPFILNRRAWPFPADRDHFNDLPARHPSLLFAARAYTRPEYADLWKTLNPDPTAPELQRTFPISQPLLWVARSF